MAGITVDVLGNKAILDNLAAFDAHMQAEAQSLLEQAGQMALDQANTLVPVKTGYLKSRNELYINPGDVTVGNDAPYAIFIELGTRKMAAQPFLYPSFVEAGQWLQQALMGMKL